LLTGRVEVDETYLGGPRVGTRGRGAEENGNRIGRICMARIIDVSGPSLEGFIKTNVVPGTTVHSDAWRGYYGLDSLGYIHEVTNLSCSNVPAHVVMPRVHRVASLLNRWILGTHQGAVSHEHLEYYLDEFTFRFNRRSSKSRRKLFYRLIQQAVDTEAEVVPYSHLFGGTSRAEPLYVAGT
jgi:transposase-like protein